MNNFSKKYFEKISNIILLVLMFLLFLLLVLNCTLIARDVWSTGKSTEYVRSNETIDGDVARIRPVAV